MVMGLIGAGLGVAAPLVANALGIGKNDTRAKTFDESSAYDPHAFQYGGTAGGANQAANDFRLRADAAQARGAAQAGLVGVNYGQANYDRQLGQQDRVQQNQVARMMMARAMGQVPSIAGQQAALDMQRAGAAQSSAAASARGAAGLALAGQNAANNTATMQSAISNNAQINAANERLAAEQGAYGAYSGIRAGDAQSQGLAAQQAQYASQLAAQQNQFNAGLMQQQHGLNDAYSSNMLGQMNNVRQMQMNGGIAGQGLLGTSQMNATNENIGISQYNANREYGYYKDAMGSLSGGLQAGGSMMGGGPSAPQPATGVGAPTSGISTPTPGGVASTNFAGIPQAGSARADGGPVAAGHPYLVGERGPELVVPARNGLVLPAEHPASRAAVGSDDRMKSGITPLGLLGVFGPGGSGGNMNPSSGPAASSYEVLSGGGENVAASGQAMNQAAMQYQTDPTSYGDGPGAHPGMMNQGLLSDDRAKQQAYNLGKAHGREDLIDDVLAPKLGNNPSNMGEMTLAQKLAYANTVSPIGAAIDYFTERKSPEPAAAPVERARPAPDMGGIDRDAQYFRAPATARASGPDMFDRDAQYMRRDPITEQFAAGLAPIRFQYKPGMGPGGEQTGVRAQAAASQPVTASMVTRRPDGLLQLDPQMGLGTALAGVGHLAKKQQDNEAKLDGLLAMAARREGY